MKYNFIGKLNGALGFAGHYSIEVEADNEEKARLKIYDTHEHLKGVEISEVKNEHIN